MFKYTSVAALAVMTHTVSVWAVTVPFIEEFEAGPSDWFDSAGLSPLNWSAAGGPDGGAHALTTFNLATLADGDTPALFRAQDEFDSSGGAFEGDWISGGVAEFRAFVRHDAPFPQSFFVRFSSPINFPGAIAVQFVPVFSDTWTEIVIDIDPENPQLVSFEGSDFVTVFSNIGHVQVGITVGEGQGGFPVDITFDLDKVAIGDCTANDSCEPAAVPTASHWAATSLTLILLTAGTLRCGRYGRRTLT